MKTWQRWNTQDEADGLILVLPLGEGAEEEADVLEYKIVLDGDLDSRTMRIKIFGTFHQLKLEFRIGSLVLEARELVFNTDFAVLEI